MAKNKISLSPENITEWLASTGFLLPRNEVELQRFEKLYSDQDFGIRGDEIDPQKILDGTYSNTQTKKPSANIQPEEFSDYRMAARKGDTIPKHILEKMKKNQKESSNDPTPPEDPDKQSR
jgi:hypothetical protein